MLPHLNRPGYGFHHFQGKTPPEKEVPVFIKQLFRLLVISTPHTPHPVRGCRRWLLRLGGYQQIWKLELAKSHQGRPFECARFRTERNVCVRGSGTDVDALPQTHNSCCCYRACGAAFNPSDRKIAPAVLTICTQTRGDQPLYWWPRKRGRFIARGCVNGPRVTNTA